MSLTHQLLSINLHGVMLAAGLWLSGTMSGWAQGSEATNYCTNPPSDMITGGFTLSQTRVCQGELVEVTAEAPGLTQVSYTFTYTGSGMPLGTATRQYAYTDAGQFTVLQQAMKGAAKTVACRTVTVLSTAPYSYSVSRCAGRRATIHLQASPLTASYTQILVDWGDGTVQYFSPTALIEHVYQQAGTFLLQVTGSYIGMPTCSSDAVEQIVTIADSPSQPPYFSRIENTDGQRIELDVQGGANNVYILWRGNTATTLQATGQLTAGTTFSVVTPPDQVVCFQLRQPSTCQQAIQSDVICTTPLAVAVGDGVNTLNWQAYQGTGSFTSWQVTRNGSTLPIDNPASPAEKQTEDKTVIRCGALYCYQLQYTVGQTQVIAYPVCTTGLNTTPPPAPDRIYVSVNEQMHTDIVTKVLTITPDEAFTLVVSRSNQVAGPYTRLVALGYALYYEDKTSRADEESCCYQVAFRNQCGATSPPSAPACSVWLSSSVSTGIDWSSISPYSDGPVLNYSLFTYDRQTGQLLNERNLGLSQALDLSDPDIERYTYRIVTVDQSDTRSYSNVYRFVPQPRLYIPNAFTPNADGQNDQFVVQGEFIEGYQLTIYNRWGDVVFQTDSMHVNWDGRIQGQMAPLGQYSYQIKLTSDIKPASVYRGSLQLIR